MKLLRYSFLSAGILVASCGAPSKLKKADKLYDKVAYAKAAELYTSILDNDKVDEKHVKSRLADCYYQMGETQKAEEVYASFVQPETASNEDVYQYAQSLKENGKYAESEKWMKSFTTKAMADQRAKNYQSDRTYLENILAQKQYFSLRHLDVNTKYADFGGYPMTDSTSYFISNRRKRAFVKHQHTYNSKSFLDLYAAKRSENGDLTDVSMKSRKVNKRFHEGSICFSPDNKKVYFTQNNMSKGKLRKDEKGVQKLKLYIADVDAEGKWVNKTEFPYNSQNHSVGHPTLSADGKTLYFASDMAGGIGGSDIYKVAVKEDGIFGEPVNLGTEINTEGQEMFPWITADNTLFFSSDGHPGLGGLDVYAMLSKKDGSFSKLINLGKPVNSQNDDFAFIVNADNTTGYVSSNRAGGTGDDDIYSVTNVNPLKVDLLVQGVVKDKHSGNILPASTVELLDADGNVISSTTADENGKYEFSVDPEKSYTIAARKDDYFDNSTAFNTVNLPKDAEVLEENVILEKDPGLSLYALVTDAKTKQPLDGVTMIITDNMTGKIDTLTLPQTGDYRRALADKKLNDRGSYNIQLFKDEYIPKTVTYNTKFDKEGQYDVHTSLDLSLDPMVKDLAELIEINPINFDLNKYNIRPDAAKELDKIVEIMNKYPNMEVELGAHTDCRGSKVYNTRLSDRRAKASAAYIKKKITNPERIYGKGYGETKLLNDCACEGRVKSDCSEEEHAENRRTEFRVISVGKDNVGVKNNSSNSFD